MAYGWNTDKGINTFCQAGEQALCGPSCVAMAIEWVKGDKIDAKTISSSGKQKGMSLKFNPANINNPAMKKTIFGDQDDYGSLAGMGSAEVKAALADYSIAATLHRPGGAGVFNYSELRALLNKATAATPVIIQLANPSHFVICGKRAKNFFGGKNKYSIADPADGRVYTGAHVAGNKIIFSGYNTTITSIISVTGKIAHARVRVM